MALSEKTNNDIRSCLALLQCLKQQAGDTVKLGQIHAAALGEKDMQKGLFTVWQEIFQIQRPKRYRIKHKLYLQHMWNTYIFLPLLIRLMKYVSMMVVLICNLGCIHNYKIYWN